MSLLVQTIHKEMKTLFDNNIKLHAIGDLEALPVKIHRELDEAIQATAHHDRMCLTLALSYSSRWEITKTLRSIAESVRNGELDPASIDQNYINERLTTTGLPDPELLIRTSGEYRISNFLLWQIAYTELYFSKKYWPDFKKEDLYEAIVDFQKRERRFGKISEQISEKKNG